MKKAVILFSGGLDSTTCLAMAKQQGFACYALSFAYEQRHAYELEAAKRLASMMGALDHRIIPLGIGQFGGSALTDTNIPVPEYENQETIPVTYVPARNTIFLSIALGFAETLDAQDIFIGVNANDYSNYPDCRPDFIESFQKTANLATKIGVEGKKITIHTPLLYLSKAEIIKKGLALGVEYGQTVSCYRLSNEGEACGTCLSCELRREGFKKAAISDPTLYKKVELLD